MSGTQTVLVGCKAPNGVILNLDRLERESGNPQDIRVRRVRGATTVTLKGWAKPFNREDRTAETGGYALTPVPADFWEAWVATHPDFPMLLDGTILAPTATGGERRGNAMAQAREHEKVERMNAPLNPDGDHRTAPTGGRPPQEEDESRQRRLRSGQG